MSSLFTASKKTLTYSATLLSTTLLLVVTGLSMSGCSTTHEIKPTATVMVGTHKSI